MPQLCRAFIKDANQAGIVASGENLEAKRDFLQKVGSNPHLRARALFATPKKSFALLAELPYSARSASISDPNSEGYLTLLAFIDAIRTALAESPDEAAIIQHNIKMLREQFDSASFLGDPEDYSSVVSQGEQALREICLSELNLGKRRLKEFVAQRCTKVDVVSRGDQSRSRSNCLLVPSDWQLVALAGKATLAPLLGEDIAAFIRANHADTRKLLAPFPFVARMPDDRELSDEVRLKVVGAARGDQG